MPDEQWMKAHDSVQETGIKTITKKKKHKKAQWLSEEAWCEAKWALGSITMNKASGGDGILVELFQILKDDAMKVLH